MKVLSEFTIWPFILANALRLESVAVAEIPRKKHFPSNSINHNGTCFSFLQKAHYGHFVLGLSLASLLMLVSSEKKKNKKGILSK